LLPQQETNIFFSHSRKRKGKDKYENPNNS